MLHASIPISVTASCANTDGTLRDDGSCATDSTDSFTNNHTAIAAGLTGPIVTHSNCSSDSGSHWMFYTSYKEDEGITAQIRDVYISLFSFKCHYNTVDVRLDVLFCPSVER